MVKDMKHAAYIILLTNVMSTVDAVSNKVISVIVTRGLISLSNCNCTRMLQLRGGVECNNGKASGA